MRVLGIETSCDETAAAVVEAAPEGHGGRILSNVVLGQVERHAAFGGVVPEIAARAHVEVLDGIVEAALRDAALTLEDVDGIAVTAGPGLIGGVIVGVMTAKALAFAAQKPLIAVNHLEGHALTVRLTDGLAYPYLLLLVSGGHTQIIKVDGLGDYHRLGSTIDDAAGEAFDKTAKLLDLGFPGGPAVEQTAKEGDPARFSLPRPLLSRAGLDMSFAGLKTAVRQAAIAASPLDAQGVADLCASFQQAVADILGDRVQRALNEASDPKSGAPPPLVVAGGVAANRAIRTRLRSVAEAAGSTLVAPPPALCTDNAAMIAYAGAERLACGQDDGVDFAPRSRWPLDRDAAPVLGHGKHGVKV